MSFLAGIYIHPPSAAPAAVMWAWIAAAIIFCLFGNLLRYLRAAGTIRASRWIGRILLLAAICWAGLIEFEYWRVLAEPTFDAPPLSAGSDGTTVDHDGEIRSLIASAAVSLPILLLAVGGTIAGWVWPVSSRQRARN